MNVLDAVELINRVQFRDWIIVSQYKEQFGTVYIELRYRALDSCAPHILSEQQRRIGVVDSKIGVMQNTHLTAHELHDMDEKMVLEYVRQEIHKLVAHEVDEVISFDGARPWNPHRSADEQKTLLDELLRKEIK